MGLGLGGVMIGSHTFGRVRLIVSGALDRNPGLKIVLGYLGEGLPFWSSGPAIS